MRSQRRPPLTSSTEPTPSETQFETRARLIRDAEATPIDLSEVDEHRDQLYAGMAAEVRRIMAEQGISQHQFSKRIGQKDNTMVSRILYRGERSRDMRLGTLALLAMGLHKKLEIRFVDEDES